MPSSAGYPLGISEWLNIPTSLQVYLGFSLVSAVSVSIVLLFEGRYYVLGNGSSENRNWKRKLYVVVLYTLSFLFFAPSYLNIPNQINGKVDLIQKIPCLPPDFLNRPGFFVLAVDATICVLCVSFMTMFLMTQGLFFAISIAWQLTHSSSKSKTVNKMQKQLMIALGVQVTIPISVFFVPTAILVTLFWKNHFNQGATNIAVVMVSIHGIVSTITMLIVHKPYREATLDLIYRLLSKKRKTINGSKIWITVAGQHVLKSVIT